MRFNYLTWSLVKTSKFASPHFLKNRLSKSQIPQHSLFLLLQPKATSSLAVLGGPGRTKAGLRALLQEA